MGIRLGSIIINLLKSGGVVADLRDITDRVGDPSREYDLAGERTYSFDQFGFAIKYRADYGLSTVIFQLANQGVKTGRVKSYEGDLPFGVRAGDLRQDIRTKIGSSPKTSGPFPDCDVTCMGPLTIEKYYREPLEYSFVFDSSDSLVLLTVVRFFNEDSRGA